MQELQEGPLQSAPRAVRSLLSCSGDLSLLLCRETTGSHQELPLRPSPKLGRELQWGFGAPQKSPARGKHKNPTRRQPRSPPAPLEPSLTHSQRGLELHSCFPQREGEPGNAAIPFFGQIPGWKHKLRFGTAGKSPIPCADPARLGQGAQTGPRQLQLSMAETRTPPKPCWELFPEGIKSSKESQESPLPFPVQRRCEAKLLPGAEWGREAPLTPRFGLSPRSVPGSLT